MQRREAEGCQLLGSVPQRDRDMERRRRTCAQLWDTECVSQGAGSSGAVLNSYQMCSLVNDLIWKNSTVDMTRQPFSTERFTPVEPKEPSSWKRIIFSPGGSYSQEKCRNHVISFGDVSRKWSMDWTFCQEFGVPGAAGTKEMRAQIGSTSNTLSYRFKDHRPLTCSLVRN